MGSYCGEWVLRGGGDKHKATRTFFKSPRLEGEKTDWKSSFQLPIPLEPVHGDLLHRHALLSSFPDCIFVGWCYSRPGSPPTGREIPSSILFGWRGRLSKCRAASNGSERLLQGWRLGRQSIHTGKEVRSGSSGHQECGCSHANSSSLCSSVSRGQTLDVCHAKWKSSSRGVRTQWWS